MKVSDGTSTPTLFMPSSPLLKKNKAMKSFKLNRRLNNHMTNVSKSSPPTVIPINNNYQIIPMSSMWTNTSLTPLNSMVTLINTNPISINTSSSPVVTSPSIHQQQQQQHSSIYPSYKPFTAPRVTTTLIPLNICPMEYCQTGKPTSPLSVNIIENHQQQNVYEHKSKDTVVTHLIGDWIIRESSKPFERKINEQKTLIEQLIHQEKTVIPSQSSSPNVNQWTINDVCSFFERVLGKNYYTSVIQEHLIDGAALLLLEDEHLVSIFQMQLGPRLKLLDRIRKLKKGDLSAM